MNKSYARAKALAVSWIVLISLWTLEQVDLEVVFWNLI